jgi:hypothetical protein
MNLELDDVKTRTPLNVLVEAIEADRYPFSPRIRLLRQILAKFGELAPAPPPPARPPTPEERRNATRGVHRGFARDDDGDIPNCS